MDGTGPVSSRLASKQRVQRTLDGFTIPLPILDRDFLLVERRLHSHRNLLHVRPRLPQRNSETSQVRFPALLYHNFTI